MESKKIGNELSAQFERTHQMLAKTIESYQGSAWVEGKENYLVPARLAYHLVETIEYYLSDASSEEFSWGGRFGGDWEGMPASDLPGQKEMIEYLGGIVHQLRVGPEGYGGFDQVAKYQQEAVQLWQELCQAPSRPAEGGAPPNPANNQ